MFLKRALLIILIAGALLLVSGIGPHLAQATSSTLSGVTIPYSGRLSGDAGQPATDGLYDFNFALYDAESSGTLLWSEWQQAVPVKGGVFVVALGSVNPLSAAALGANQRWLAVSVRGPEDVNFSALTPRQRLDAKASAAPSAPANPSAGLSCAHTHFAEGWSGSNVFGLVISNTIAMPGPTFGLIVRANNPFPGPPTPGVPIAIQGETSSSNGVAGAFDNLGGGVALSVQSNGSGADHAALRVNNTLTTTGMAAYLTNNSNFATANIHNSGTGDMLYLESNGGQFIYAVRDGASDNPKFRVSSDGAAFADGGWQGNADFAELMTTADPTDAYEPGDVLVIGQSDRSVALSSEPYSTLVAGVYSTKPGFVGSSHVMEDQRANEVPVAVVGIVPVKVSAENGAIHRGDLLVTSSTPGYAMRGINPPAGTILGKALESLAASHSTGVILVLVTLQ